MTVDLSAIARWPNVPACYDWLSLDRRGNWRLQGERVSHHGFIALLNRQYGVDDRGCWFVQNGPQRVFVELAYTPWVFHCDGQGFASHTGETCGKLKGVYLDQEGSILLETALGIGLLDDRDLPAFLQQCRLDDDAPVDEESWLKMLSGQAASPIMWQQLAIQAIQQDEIAGRFHFQPNPRP